MIYDTLEYTDDSSVKHEIALALGNVGGAAGVVSMQLDLVSHAIGTLALTWAQPPETGINIPYKSPCVVRLGRSSADGSEGSFSSGAILFQGRRTDNSGSRASNRVRSGIVLSDVMWDLSQITYQQAANEITGGTLTSPTFTPFYWPDVVLFQAFNGVTYTPAPVSGTITTWQQIMDVLNYALGFIVSGTDQVNFQFNTTPEFSAQYRNWDSQRSVKCLDAIMTCLRSHPGVYVHVDHSTVDGGGNPSPTLHFRNRGSMTAASLPYLGNDAGGNYAQATDIQSLDHLVPDNVRIYYRINGTFNGQPVSTPAIDAWPANANALNNLDFSVDITGSSRVQMIQDFTSATFDPTSLTLWRQKVAALHQISQGGSIPNDGDPGALALVNSTAYDASTNPKGIQLTGDDGTDYSTSYGSLIPYWTDDNIYSWFQLVSGAITVKKVTAKAWFKCQKKGAGGSTDNIKEQQHTMRLVLCSIPAGRYISPVITTASGESVPTGLAQAIYTELADLQWKFTHQILEVAASDTAVPTIIQPGLHKVNLTGGNAAWATMNAVPERVAITIRRNASNRLVFYSRISCGPVRHLNPKDLIALANVFWWRGRAGVDAQSRLSGSSAGGNVNFSLASSAKENSIAANAQFAVQNLVGEDSVDATRTNVIKQDATGAQFQVVQQKTSDNTVYTTGIIAPEYSAAGAPSATTLPANTYYREGDQYVDKTTPTAPIKYRCMTAGTNSTSVWAQISAAGSGNAPTPFKIVSDGGDYWICKSWDGTTLGSVPQNILKPHKLRAGTHKITSEVIRGITYTYTYTPVYITGSSGPIKYYTQQRSGTDGSTGTAYVIPDPIANDIIYAHQCTITDISMNRTILTAVIHDGGTGYVSGDVGKVLAIAGGTGTSATLTIGAVAAGKITAVSITTIGDYSAAPSLSANAATGSTTGSGATFDLTLSPILADDNRNSRAYTI